jgi:hypothetical protein
VVRHYFFRASPPPAETTLAAFSNPLLVTNIPYLNQIPDRKADRTGGKRYWAVRPGAERALELARHRRSLRRQTTAPIPIAAAKSMALDLSQERKPMHL